MSAEKFLRDTLRCCLIIAVCLLSLITPLIALRYIAPPVEASPGWLSGWQYRQSHEISNRTGAGTNYQLFFNVYRGSGSSSGNSVYLNNHNASLFPNDLNFTGDDETTPLDYWVENYNSSWAGVWVEIQDDLSTTARTIYLYYGKSGVTSSSNIFNTGLSLSDDFNDDSINPQWTTVTQTGDTAEETGGAFHTKCPHALWHHTRARSTNTLSSSLSQRNRQKVKCNPLQGRQMAETYYGTSDLATAYWGVFFDVVTTNKIKFYTRAGGTWALRWTSTNTISTDTYYIWDVLTTATQAKLIVYNADESLREQSSWYSIDDGGAQYVHICGVGYGYATSPNANAYVDWVLRGKYVTPEPLHGSWGPESQPDTVTLNFPINGEWYFESKLVSFKFTPIIRSGTYKNASLWTNATGTWTRTSWNQTVIWNGTFNVFLYTFTSEATYLWNVQVYKGDNTAIWGANRSFLIDVSPWTRTFYPTTADGMIRNVSETYTTAVSGVVGEVYNASGYDRVGQRLLTGMYNVWRGFLPFNTSILPFNFKALSANISVYRQKAYDSGDRNPDFNITVMSGMPTYPHIPLQTGDYYRSYYSGNGGLFDTTGWADGWNTIQLNSVGRSWINVDGWTKLCLRSSRDINEQAPSSGDTQFIDFEDAENTTYRPTLVVYGVADSTMSSHENQLRDPYERKSYYAASRTWVFCFDGMFFGYTSSADYGQSWTQFTPIGEVPLDTAGKPNYGEDGAVFYDPTNNKASYILCTSQYKTVFAKGIPLSNGTIQWLTSEQTIHKGSALTAYYSMPYISIDSNGCEWVGAQWVNGTCTGRVLKNQFNNGTWQTAITKDVTFQGTMLDAPRVVTLRLLEGKVGVLTATLNKPAHYYRWNGATWDIQNETATTSNLYHGDFMSAVTVLDDVHFTFNKVVTGTSYLVYTKRNSTAWESETVLVSASVIGACAQLTWDRITNEMRVAWENQTNSHIYYKIRYQNGSWSGTVDWITSSYPLTNERTAHFGYESYTSSAGALLLYAYEVNYGGYYKFYYKNITIPVLAHNVNLRVMDWDLTDSIPNAAVCMNNATDYWKTSSTYGWANYTGVAGLVTVKAKYFGFWVNGSFSMTISEDTTLNVRCKLYDVYIKILPSNQQGVLYTANVTVFNATSVGNNKIRTALTNQTGYVYLTNLPNNTLTFTVYAIAQATLTKNPFADSYVFSASPDANYGSDQSLRVLGETDKARTFLNFTYSDLPLNANVTEVKLSLYAYQIFGVLTHNVSRVTASWTESGITWNNQPAVTFVNSVQTYVGTQVGWKDYYVTQMFKDTLADKKVSLRIHDIHEGSVLEYDVLFRSKEANQNIPKLEITYLYPLVIANTTRTPTSEGQILSSVVCTQNYGTVSIPWEMIMMPALILLSAKSLKKKKKK